MKKRMAVGWLIGAVMIGRGVGHAAEAPSLMVGDPAPKLQVSKWVQGEPVKDFERGKAYVVEFWATWCGPCVATIPHVNELHARLKDKGLVVIGQNVWENDTSKVVPFVNKMGDKMTYRVALDSTEGSTRGQMADTWMKAARQNGIPTAFVVDKQGKIAWIGHPAQLKQPLLQEVLDGKFDLAKAAATYKERMERKAQEEPLWQEFTKRMKNKEYDKADAALTKLENLQPAEERDQYGITRFQFLLERKDYEAAYKYAARLMDSHPDNSFMQNELAWRIATGKGIEHRDLHLAEKIARQANQSSGGKDPGILDTLARVLYMKGKKDDAIAYQSKAVEYATGSRKKQFQATLDTYKKGEDLKGF